MLSGEGHIGMELLAEKEAISAGSRRHSTGREIKLFHGRLKVGFRVMV